MNNKRNFRDFLYDKNDLIIALLIIVVAMLIITWCVMRVMDYPNTLDSVKTAEEIQSAVDEQTTESSDPNVPIAKWESGKLAEDITVTLSSDSTDAAIGSLVASNLFTSADQFKKVCAKLRLSDADIKAGKFTFKKGSNLAAIAKQVTK